MKRNLLLLLLTFATAMHFAAGQTVTLKPANASYKTGYAFNAAAGASRNDGNMLVNHNASGNSKRGYAVFDLSSVVPTGATVTAVTLRFKITNAANTANPTVTLKGYAGDMSTITNADTVFAKCDLGSSLSATTSYGGTTGTFTPSLNSTGVSFINSNISGKITLCWSPSSNAGQTYTIAGYAVDSTAPMLTISYTCASLSTTTASASPNPVCATATLSLTGSVTGGSTYSWIGPSGSSYTSTAQNPTLTASAASAGVYSFTVTNSAGCYYKATTSSVTVTPLPGTISGATSMCPSSTATLTCSPSGGTWSSSVTSVASINPTTGAVASTASGGTTNISYTTTCGSSGLSLSVNSTVGAISGASSVCTGSSTTFSNASGGGGWTTSNAAIASVHPTSGLVYGVAAGSATITYTPPCGSFVTRGITVNSLPTISVTPSSSATCLNSLKQLTASGGSSYTWAPTTGLSATTGSIVYSSSTVAVTYTVTGSNGSCSSTATTVLTAGTSPQSVTPLALPGLTCSGGASTLSASFTNSNYNTVTSIDYSLVTQTSPTTVAGWTGGVDDGYRTVSLPFTFYFYGSAYTSVNIGTNGYINFGTATTDLSSYTLPSTSAPQAMIALFERDMRCPAGTVLYSTEGTAPNRKFVVYYNGVRDFSTTNTSFGQIVLYETTNIIDLIVTSTASSLKSCGVQNLGGTAGVPVPGRNNTTYQVTTPEAWRFTGVPSAVSYSWSPVTSLSASTGATVSASPLSATTSYTVSALDSATSCLSTANTTVTVGTLTGTISASSSICPGTTTTVTFTGPATDTVEYNINGGTTQFVVLNSLGTATVTTAALTSTTTYNMTAIRAGVCYQALTGVADTISILSGAGPITATTPLCVASSATFTDGVAGGTWSTANSAIASVSTSGVVTGVAAGTTTISYLVGSCPAATASVNITSAPASITPATAVSICTGNTATLANTVSGGTWSSSDTTLATVDAATGVVTGLVAGSLTITYDNGCGTPATKSVTIVSSPTPITDAAYGVPPSAICTLSSYTYYDTSGSGTWSNSPTTVGTVNSSGVFNSGTATGTTTISYTLGTCTVTSPLNVGSTPPVAITGTTTVCAQATTTLSDASTGGVWSSGDNSLATVNSSTGVVTGVNAGTVNISYTNGCGSPVTASVTVNGATPVLSADTVCTGGTLHLTATVSATGSYSWTGPNSFTSTALSPSIGSVTANAAGTYSFATTSTVGACTTSTRVFAVVNTTPSVTVTASPATICLGDTATLSSVVTAPTSMTMYAIPYNPIAITSGTNGPTGDDAQTNVTLPFTFNYFGTNFTTVRICTNGFINFGAANTAYTPVALPSTGAAQGMIALFWHDLTATAGQIKYTTIGSSPNRKFVVTYNNVADLSGAGTNTGQVVLYESSNMIDLFVLKSNVGGATNLCGIQNNGRTTALTPPGENATTFRVASPGEGWRFVIPSYNYSWTPSATLSTATDASVLSSGLTSTQVFTVTTRDAYSYCAGNVSTTTVNVNSINIYTVTGGNGCSATGVTVGLSGSDATAIYQLRRDGGAVGSPVSGTGSAISFGVHTTAGVYTVMASRGSCTANMAGADTIGTTPAVTIGTSPAICQPSTIGVVSFTSPIGSPSTYNVIWDAAAVTAGFSSVSSVALGSSVSLTAPSGVTGTYSGSVTVSNGSCTSAAYPVTLTIYAAPVGSVTAAVPPCSGYSTNVVFTGTPGATLSYRVDGGTLVTATIPGGGVYNIVTGAITSGHTYLIHQVYNPACSQTYDTLITVTPTPMQWTGGTVTHENDWNTSTNWSCGFVPGATDHVTIPLTTNNPAIGAAATGTTANLTIDSGATVSIGSAGSLLIKGAFTNNGRVIGQGVAVMNGTANQTISGIGSVNNFQLNNTGGATISTAARLTVDSLLTMTADTLRTNDSLVIGADTAHTARIAAITGGYISGKARVMQTIQGGYRRYRFWSHPFMDVIPFSQMQQYVDLTGAGGASNGFTATATNSPSVYRYSTLAGNSTLSYDPGWKVVTSALPTAGDSNKIARYQGVRVYLRGAKGEGLGYATYTPSATVVGQWGNLNQGRQVVPLTKGSSTGQDYNFLGNPYASPVDIGTVAFNAKASGNIIGSFYIWNPTLGTGGQFTAYPISTVAATPYYISASTGFEVRAAHNGDSLVFNESNKGIIPSANLLRTLPEYTSLYIYDESYHLFDLLHVKFDNNTTDEQDNVNDADKLMGGDLNFYSLSADGKRQAIDVRPYNAAKAIPVGITSQVAQTFIIRAENVVLPEGGQLYLHDKLLQTYTSLVQGAEYKFSITKDAATQGNERFEIGMKPELISSVAAFDVSITPNPASNDVKVTYSNSAASETTIRLTDMNGVTVYSKNLGNPSSGVLTIPLQKLASGIYLVELTSGDRKVTRRLVKE